MTKEEKTELLNRLLEIEEKNDIGNLTRAERGEFQQWVKDALEQEPCETIEEIPKDYKYDTETKDFLVYRHMYTGHEIHIEKPVPRYRLEQEPVLDKIRAEIEYIGGDDEKAFCKNLNESYKQGLKDALKVIDKYKAESEGK